MFSSFLWPCAALFIFFIAQNFLQYLLAGNAPPLVLIAVVYYSLKKSALTGAFLGLFAGALMEIFAQGPLGAFMIPMALAGAASGGTAAKIFQDSWPAAILIPCVTAYFFSLAELACLQIQWGQGSWDIFGLAFQGRSLLWTLFLSPVVFFILGKTHGTRQS